MRDGGGRQAARPRRRYAVDPLHGLHAGLLQAGGQRLHHRRRITSAIPLDKSLIAPAAHQQMLAADLQRGVAVLPRQQQWRRMQRLQLARTRPAAAAPA